MKNVISEPGQVLSKKGRVEIIGNEIAIFAPGVFQATVDQTIYESNNRALSRYEPRDQSLRFPKTSQNVETIWEVLSADADYVFSDDFKAFCKARQRVEIIDGQIAVFLLYPDCASLRIQEPKGRYNDADRSFRYSLSDVLALTPLLPPKIERSPEFSNLLADAVKQKEFKQMKRIDLLPDEHPNRCVAVYYPKEPSPTINPEFFWFRDKVDSGVYESLDCSWRFPLTVIRLLAIEFSSPAYYHSERFLKEFDPIDCGF